MTIKGSVVKPTEIMSEKDTIDSFCDGAKKAAEAARLLAKELDSPEWGNMATVLESMREGGKKLYEMKSMSRFETLMAAQMKAAPYKPN